MLGFETIGSATIIVYDGDPVLTTDAWINDDAYFGSWAHDYAIPPAQMDAIRRARFHWMSHGHPDHLNADSLPMLTAGKILLSDHYGGRIRADLDAQGHAPRVLKDREWAQLSPRVKICAIANQNQDSILLIDVGGTLIVNTNDSPDFGASFWVRGVARGYKRVFYCGLNAWGGADMMNLFDPEGRKLTDPAALRRPIAPRAQGFARRYGAHFAIPFSGFHAYQRTDSAWANALVPALGDYQSDAGASGPQMLPAFVRVDAQSGAVDPISPPQCLRQLKTPEACGDSWSDPMTAEDAAAIGQYFRAREHLADAFGFIQVTIGGRSTTVDLNPDKRGQGVAFEAPRTSFMTAIRHAIFDDLLIGNYMKTTLHGVAGLYPDFSPYVCKYGDNGGALSGADLAGYFGHYRLRDPIGAALRRLSDNSEQVFRALIPKGSGVFRAAKKFYHGLGARAAR